MDLCKWCMIEMLIRGPSASFLSVIRILHTWGYVCSDICCVASSQFHQSLVHVLSFLLSVCLSFILLLSYSNSVPGIMEAEAGEAWVRMGPGGFWRGAAAASDETWVWIEVHQAPSQSRHAGTLCSSLCGSSHCHSREPFFPFTFIICCTQLYLFLPFKIPIVTYDFTILRPRRVLRECVYVDVMTQALIYLRNLSHICL